MVQVHQNQIGGEGRPALSGAVFEVSAPWTRADEAGSSGVPGPKKTRTRSLGTWPRSGAADVSAAIGSARARGAAWSGVELALRREILARAARELASDSDPGGLLAARLGLETVELAPHLVSIAGVLERALLDPSAAFAGARAAEPGLMILAPAWSELVSPVAAALFSALALGRSVLYVSDPHAPMIGDELAKALERAGLPKGVLSVVHDDGEDALRAALQSGAASYVRGSGYPNRIRRLERLATGGSGPDFGSGVQRASAPAIEMRILRSKTTVVRSSEDPSVRATQVVDGAFGRSASLSGQLPGQIGRVACSDRSFSKFTEVLLAELRRNPDVSRPAPIVERESEDRLRRVRVLGLDEGATLIFDGEDVFAAGAGDEPRRGAASSETADGASPRSPAGAMLAPTVFTNVEERMRLTLLGRPLPLLCLLRVPDDAEGLALAVRLDRDVPAEDLTFDAPI